MEWVETWEVELRWRSGTVWLGKGLAVPVLECRQPRMGQKKLVVFMLLCELTRGGSWIVSILRTRWSLVGRGSVVLHQVSLQ
jgi:hypothetical protein